MTLLLGRLNSQQRAWVFVREHVQQLWPRGRADNASSVNPEADPTVERPLMLPT